MPAVTLRCVVEGRVQGVFYRASTAELAESLGLHGTVRNLDDGNVELVVAGDDQAVRKLVAWLWQGPPGAEVRAVSVEEWTGAVADGFRIAP